MDTFNVFILCPKDALSEVITDEDSYQGYLNQISDLINRADCEKGVVLFYDNSEYQEFANALDELAYAGEFYLIKPRRILSTLLKKATDLTENGRTQRENYFYALWDFESRSVVANIPISVKQAFEYQINSAESKQLLLNLGAEFYPLKKDVFIFRDVSSYDNQEMPIFIKLGQVSNFNDLEEWLKENRTPRLLNSKDPRHNEQSPEYVSKPTPKSPILYDFKHDEEAINYVQSLLDTAVFDKYSAHNAHDLVNYDSRRNRYIWFEYESENPQNQYHAYHLAIPRIHEADQLAVERIPKRAKRFIDRKIP